MAENNNFTNKLRAELTDAGIVLLKDVGGMIYNRRKYVFKDIPVKMALIAAADDQCRVLGMKDAPKAAAAPPADDKKPAKSSKD